MQCTWAKLHLQTVGTILALKLGLHLLLLELVPVVWQLLLPEIVLPSLGHCCRQVVQYVGRIWTLEDSLKSCS